MSETKRIMSFDIGIKNMAYCIFELNPKEINNNPFKILDWNILNLMEKEEPHLFCNCSAIKTKEKKERISKNPKKSKKVVCLKNDIPALENKFIDASDTLNNTNTTNQDQIKLCGRAAKFKKGDSLYCEKHVKTQSAYIIPTKRISLSSLKKQKLEELLKICVEFSILEEGESIRTKKAALEKMDAFFKVRCLDSVIEQKSKTAGATDLIIIGKNMKILLNQISEIERITHVIIENQISPIANRMKTVQGMLAQYFIMKNTDINIDFISSANKLRIFSSPKGAVVNNGEKSSLDLSNNNTEETTRQKYSQHKKDGVFYTIQILEKNPWLHIWNSHVSQSKKKDDLADSFLQGLWFLNSREIIKIEEDLQIFPII